MPPLPSGPALATEEELGAERRYLDRARDCLAAMRARAAASRPLAGDKIANEALAAAFARRVESLADAPDTPLFFGRLDLDSGERVYVGRRHVADDRLEPVVVDWRAGIATAFYRATAGRPMDTLRRRRFGYRRGELTSYEDELLAGPATGAASRLVEDEIERPRVGPMRDIVATISPDQDEIVRADLDTSICVQGAPGTGKTAVGLHRAAYLLYTYRQALRRTGVLVVGPNEAFLAYISQVLPALGEVTVTQTSVDGLVTDRPEPAPEPAAVAALKGDARMADVLRRALHRRHRFPTEELVVPHDGGKIRLSAGRLRAMVVSARTAGLRYAAGRERLGALVAAAVTRDIELRGGVPTEADTRRLARSRPVRAFLEETWPVVDAERLVFELLADPALLPAAADGILDDHEQALLRWPRRPASRRRAPWSAADAFLLDEAADLVERVAGFGHVVVDEAQDLSPMQCRAIARRSSHGSLTVLGDLAQTTAAAATDSWAAALAHLGQPDAHLEVLTQGYRVPREILDLANRLVPYLAADAPLATSYRTAPGSVSFVPAAASPLPVAVERVAAGLAEAGTIGVIAADEALPALRAALDGAGIATAGPADLGGAARAVLTPASLCKGLEFDTVVLYEPAQIVRAEPRGLNRLYVALTRAVSRLDVVHAEPLPPQLR